jgi:hypothetical protein
MSQFVNFNKRDITLPPGCKDLSDVLAASQKQARQEPVAEDFLGLEKHKEHFGSAGMAQLERFAGMLLHSPSLAFVVEIAAPELQFPVVLGRCGPEISVVLTTCEVPQEEAIRDFFSRRATPPCLETRDAGTTTLVHPLPAEAAAASALVAELLQAVYALSNDAGLEFEYYEIQ